MRSVPESDHGLADAQRRTRELELQVIADEGMRPGSRRDGWTEDEWAKHYAEKEARKQGQR